jgi:hypothetical protein
MGALSLFFMLQLQIISFKVVLPSRKCMQISTGDKPTKTTFKKLDEEVFPIFAL